MASSGFKLPKTYALGEEGELQFNSGSLFSGSTGLKYNFDTGETVFSSSMSMNVVTTSNGDKPATAAISSGSDTGGGLWANETNATGAPDGSYATCGTGTINQQTSNSLVLSEYRFTGVGGVPAGVVIQGLQLDVTRKQDGRRTNGAPCLPFGPARIATKSLRLTKDIALGPMGDDLSGYVSPSTNDGPWSSTVETVTYGGATELWGQTWTAEEVRAADFGVFLQTECGRNGTGATVCNAVADIDSIEITCYYTEGRGIPYSDPGVAGRMFATSSLAFGLPAASGTFNVLCISTGSA